MDKFKSFMEKLKKNMLIYIVVWLLIAILLVAPLTYTFTESRIAGIHWIEGASKLLDNFLKFPITVIFEDKYIGDYIEGIKYCSLFYIIILVIAINKTLPKGKYDKIEHGSSDWCENGEQYKILSKKEGLILAKDNYLPLDKIGNVNVLIVGRFWCG